MNEKFKNLLEGFKKNENEIAENVIFIVEDLDLQKVIIAWKNTKVTILETISEKDEVSDWEYIWRFCRYSKAQFISLTGLEDVKAIKYLNQLKDLKLLYPDGTINSISRKYIGGVLRNSINKTTGQKDRKIEEKKTE